MLPSSFKIPGHSGVEFKNRKAFRRLKEGNKLNLFKYGEQFGQGKYEVDEKRMARVAKEKKRKGVLIIIGVFLFFFFMALSLYVFLNIPYFKENHSIIEVPEYEGPSHASEGLRKELENIELLKSGLKKN